MTGCLRRQQQLSSCSGGLAHLRLRPAGDMAGDGDPQMPLPQRVLVAPRRHVGGQVHVGCESERHCIFRTAQLAQQRDGRLITKQASGTVVGAASTQAEYRLSLVIERCDGAGSPSMKTTTTFGASCKMALRND